MLMTVLLIMMIKKIVCLKFDFEILETENPKSGPNKAIPEIDRHYLVLEKDIFFTKEVPASGEINLNRNLKFTNEERNIYRHRVLISLRRMKTLFSYCM